jgi:hypothetical protein
VSSLNEPSDLIGLRVAELPLWLDARGSGVRMAPPACHNKFLMPGVPDSGLVLRVRDGRPPGTDGWRSLCHLSGTWQLWLDGRGRYVLAASKLAPPRRHVVVDAEFAAGEVIGEFADQTTVGQGVYPLQDLDIVFYANWLAGYGDLMLHASGVDLDGAGYCFAGVSGAGKSTLAAALSSDASATVLGEDQVILRYLEGRFWIYGTPWHLDPDRCDPRGVPLRKLFFLDRTVDDGVAPCGPLDGVARLLQTAFVPYYRPAAVPAILDRLALLSEQVPFYTLGYRLGADVLTLISEG